VRELISNNGLPSNTVPQTLACGAGWVGIVSGRDPQSSGVEETGATSNTYRV
jgi:hypothetical protein